MGRIKAYWKGLPWATANAVKIFVDDTSESSEKLLKCPSCQSWPEKIEGFRVSYTGEVVCKAQELTLAQILPGLPPEGYGGCVELVDLCEGVVKDRVLDPTLNFLEGDALPSRIPQPQVMAKICGVKWQRLMIPSLRTGLLGCPSRGRRWRTVRRSYVSLWTSGP